MLMAGESSNGAEEPATETSPLLKHSASDIENGAFGGDAGEDENPMFQGLPEVMKKMWMIFPAIGVGVFLSACDQTIIVSANARIGSELKALNSTNWIASAFFLTLTSFQPLYGKLSDVFGRKACLLFAYLIFGLGNCLCGLARTMPELIAARAFSGIGGGGMTTVVSILLSDIIPLKKRGMWQGYVNIIYATGASVGAPLGGLLVDSIGWRWVFIIQTPMCLLAFFAVLTTLHLPQELSGAWRTKLAQIDFFGASTLIAAILSLLLALDHGANASWTSPFTLATLCLFPPSLTLLLYVESRIATYPLAPTRTILPRPLLSCYICNFCAFAAWMGLLFYVPLHFQVVEGLTATQAGVRLIPAILGSVSGSLLGGRYMQITGRYYYITVLAYAVSLIGNIVILISSNGIAILGLPTVQYGFVAGIILCGFGGGIGVTTTLIGLISNADPSDQAVATACSYLFRSLGSVVGVSVCATVVQQVLRTKLRRDLGVGEEADRVFELVRHSIEEIGGLQDGVRELVRGAYKRALTAAFGATVVMYVGAVGSALFIREKKLSR